MGRCYHGLAFGQAARFEADFPALADGRRGRALLARLEPGSRMRGELAVAIERTERLLSAMFEVEGNPQN